MAKPKAALPPHAEAAEADLVSALMLEPDLIPAVRELIDWTDCYFPVHQTVTRSIFALADKNEPVSPTTVYDYLAAQGEIDAAKRVPDLAEREPHGLHAVRHAEMVREAAIKRRLFYRAEDIKRIALDGNSTSADLVEFVDGLTAFAEKTKSKQALYDDLLGSLSTNGELIARAAPPNFRIRNFLTAGTLSIWAAPEKSWKTTLAVLVALVVTGHGKWLSLYDAMDCGPVIMFSGESGDWPLKSMQERILDWIYPADAVFDGESISMKPAPADIPITWGGDPPDLGNEHAVDALSDLIQRTGAKLMILDPSQAMFGTISEDVKNDFAMRQYLKKLQILARQTGCCIVVLHHFRQHVSPGFPKRSDSSYGAMMKFCDTWILMNQREEPTGDEPAGSGKLWITWGSRDGFGASHAIDINEGTHEAGRYFDLQVVEVEHALEEIAGKQAERKGQARKAASKASAENRKADIREALAGRVTGVSTGTLAGVLNCTRQTIGPTVAAMLESGELVEAPVAYENHGRTCWTKGLALPETLGGILHLAKSKGWTDAKSGTGATGATGVNQTDVTGVYAEGGTGVCKAPLTGIALHPPVRHPSEAVCSESEFTPVGGAA